MGNERNTVGRYCCTFHKVESLLWGSRRVKFLGGLFIKEIP